MPCSIRWYRACCDYPTEPFQGSEASYDRVSTDDDGFLTRVHRVRRMPFGIRSHDVLSVATQRERESKCFRLRLNTKRLGEHSGAGGDSGASQPRVRLAR